jgi:hypothetical protein
MKITFLLSVISFAIPLLAQPEEQPGPRVATRMPQLLSVLPMGAQKGSVVEIELQGEFLDRAETVLFSTSDVVARVKKSNFTRVFLEVRVSPKAEAGPCYFRVVTPRGASNLLMFRISEWPAVTEQEPNDDPRDLRAVEWPVLVSGRLETPRDVDLYRFHGKAGQRLNLNLLAARNWSTADLSLAIVDAAGRGLRQDEGTFIWDPYISFTCPADGEYVAAVMLTRMPAGGQSRTDLVYQLAIGQAPVLASVFPLYLQSQAPVELQVRGEFLDSKTWELEGGEIQRQEKGDAPQAPTSVSLAGRLNAGTPPGVRSLRLQHASGLVTPLRVMTGESPAKMESEKNDTLQTAEAIGMPVTVNGRIDSRWDEDIYRFEVESETTLVFDIDAERLGSRLDARLALLDGSGKTLAANDDAKLDEGPLNWDPQITHTFKERGTCFIKVSSQQRRGGEDYGYALSVRRPSPGFTLRLASERLSVPRGETGQWNVSVQRQEGFQGELAIEVTGLPQGLAIKPLQLKGDQTSGKIEITAAPDARLETASVTIQGKGLVDGQEQCRTALIPAAARVTGSGPGFSDYRSTEAWVSVVEPPLFSLESAASEVFLVRGGTAEFGVKIVRRHGFSGTPEFSLENAPAGVQVEKFEIVDDGRMARLTLRASESAAVGRVPDVAIVGAARVDQRSESAPRINVQVD